MSFTFVRSTAGPAGQPAPILDFGDRHARDRCLAAMTKEQALRDGSLEVRFPGHCRFEPRGETQIQVVPAKPGQ
jgi:hypothetical protein